MEQNPSLTEHPDQVVEIQVHRGITGINPGDWDACAAPETIDGGRARNPFITHAFLTTLERSESACDATGWAPHHFVAVIDGRVAGVMPLYLKGHSQGEYVFDHAWAHA